MALYTTQVRTICESSLEMSEHVGFDNINDVLNKSAPKVFNFYFPIWDEKYRITLETKILKHYYMREIGAETVGLWKLWLDERLNLIMPYYNKLYETTVLQFNPFYDVDLTTVHQGDNKRDGTNTSHEAGKNDKSGNRSGSNTKNEEGTSTTTGKMNQTGEDHNVHQSEDVSKYSDTPQGSIVDLYKDRYLTNATINNGYSEDDNTNKSQQTTEGKATNSDKTSGQFTENNSETEARENTKVGQENVKTTEQYVHHVLGANGNRTYVSKIMELREAIINIDKMIIDELADLFLGLWG